jgi:hypothetical protein
MHLKYTDGPPALVLPDGTVAQRDEAVEVKDKNVAERLLEQGWVEAHKRASTSPTPVEKEKE